MYKLIEGGVKRLADGACIPECETNTDWQEYQKWLSEGNTPEPEFTEEELAMRKQIRINSEALGLLNSTDWKVIRYLGQKALAIPSNLTEEEYLQLEQQRQEERNKVVNL